MDKTLFYGKSRSDRGVGLVPDHPSDSEVDSSDETFSDEECAEQSPRQQGRLSNGSGDSLTYSHRKRSGQSCSSLASKRAKKKKRVLVPVANEADNRMAGKGRKTLQKSRKWKKEDIPDLNVPERVHMPPSVVSSPYAYFKMMFTDKLVEEMMTYQTKQTNLYSTQQQGKSLDTTPEEFRRFLGILVLMGVYKFPSLRDYWSLHARFPPIAEVMPVKRFEALRRYVHFVDNLTHVPDGDRFYKVRPLFESLREQFLKIPAESKQSIDEVMVAYKGTRAGSLRQYICNKPDKWGFKLFCRSSSTGIIHDLVLYQGSSSFCKSPLAPNEEGLLLGAKIVLTLSRTIEDPKGTVVFFDNFFTNFDLLQIMKKELGIHCVGTVRGNRTGGADKVLKSDKVLSKEDRGSLDYCSSDGIIAVKWNDNRCVTLLSNAHGVEPLGCVNRYNSEQKSKVPVACPAIISAYNEHMGGIDLSDMLVHLYKTPAKSHRWHLPLFGYAIDVSIVNAWLVYRRDCEALGEKAMPLKPFRVSVGNSLKFTLQVNTMRPVGRPPLHSLQNSNAIRKHAQPTDDCRYDNTGHWPVAAGEQCKEQSPSAQVRGRCALCHKGVSGFKCTKCKVFLCLKSGNNCFVAFHEK